METVKLRGGVYGEGSLFSVEMKRNADVIALQKAIFYDQRYHERFTFPPSALTLYLARKDDAWLTDVQSVKDLLRGAVDTEYQEMFSWWKLTKPELLRQSRRRRDLRTRRTSYACCCSERRDALFATNYTTPSPRMSQTMKNQDANQKTTSEDVKNTNKKRKNHDIDKSVGYSTLRWEDIKPIYNFEDSYDLQPSDIPDADIELLLARIVDLRILYGQISDGNEAKRLFFIAPIVETVSCLLRDVRILVEEDVVGKNVLLKGRFEFVLKRGTKRVSIVQAKREDMRQGVVQNVTGLVALADVEDLTVAYGIVTNFLEWTYLIIEDMKIRQQEYSPIPYRRLDARE